MLDREIRRGENQQKVGTRAALVLMVWPLTRGLPVRYCFEVATPESTFYMYAETEKEKDEWIGAIGRYILSFVLRVVRAWVL
jgi:hypothetical protein